MAKKLKKPAKPAVEKSNIYSKEMENKILINRIVKNTGKATLYKISSQKIKNFNVKSNVEIWIPNFAHKMNKLYSEGNCVFVNDYFFERLVFVDIQCRKK